MPFRAILSGFAARHTGIIRGVVFCDEEGERVEGLITDPTLDVFDLDVAGASFATLIPFIVAQDPSGRIRVTHEESITWVQLLVDGYYLLVVTTSGHGRDHALAQTLPDVADAIVAHM